MDKFTAPELIKRFESLRSDRSNWENYWEKVGAYVLPEKAFITTIPTEGEQLDVRIYDTTGVNAAGLLAAGLQGHLTSPASKWFSLRIPDDELMKIEGVKTWLRQAEDAIYDVCNTSNFNHQIHEAYLDLVTFGTCALYSEEDVGDDVLRFDARPIREIFIVEDATGKIETVFRFFELTVEQAFGLYKEKAGKDCLEAYKAKQYEKKIEYLHVIGPRNTRDVAKKDSINMPVYSKIIAYKDKSFVRESGYPEMPMAVARWEKNAFNKYGYSPAMKAYGNIRTANRIVYDLLRASSKVVDPPIDAPHEGYLLPLDMDAGGINYRNSMDPNEHIKQLDIKPNIPVGIEMLKMMQDRIEQAFFVDLFLTMERASMTATEVVQRAEEKMVLLGPVLGRLQAELFKMVISRIMNTLRRKGVIKAPPPELDKVQDYQIRYEGKLAKMQRYSEAKATMDWLNMVGMMSKFKPDVVDLVDDEEVVRDNQGVFGVNPKYLRAKELIEQIRKDRAVQQEQMARLQMMQTGAGVVKDAGAAEKSFAQARAGRGTAQSDGENANA